MRSPQELARGVTDPLGVAGLALWAGVPPASYFAQHAGRQDLVVLFAGYWLGFIAVCARRISVALWRGQHARFVDPHPVGRSLSWCAIGVIMLAWLVPAMLIVTHPLLGLARIGSFAGGALCAACFWPLLDRLDRSKPSPGAGSL